MLHSERQCCTQKGNAALRKAMLHSERQCCTQKGNAALREAMLRSLGIIMIILKHKGLLRILNTTTSMLFRRVIA
jgi:hypothetical protein